MTIINYRNSRVSLAHCSTTGRDSPGTRSPRETSTTLRSSKITMKMSLFMAVVIMMRIEVVEVDRNQKWQLWFLYKRWSVSLSSPGGSPACRRGERLPLRIPEDKKPHRRIPGDGNLHISSKTLTIHSVDTDERLAAPYLYTNKII